MSRVSDDIPGVGLKTERPRPNPAADFVRHPLTPTDGFVLSRVDGVTSYEQICLITGLGVEATIDILRRLKRDGLILGPADGPASKSQKPAVSQPAAGPQLVGGSLLDRLDDGSPVDAAELTAGPDLSAELKTRLVRVRRRLKSLSAHDLLGLPPDTDRQGAKRAYLAACKELHPDRFYGKDLGPFRGILSEIFTALTRALHTVQGDGDPADGK